MADGYRVRRASMADLATLVELTEQEALEAEGRPPASTRVRQGVEAGLGSEARARYWVVVDGADRVAGAASITTEWSDWNAAPYWWVQSCYVRPEARGTGVLELLLDAIADEARRDGAPELRLYVHEDNARAVAAYRKRGFVATPYLMLARTL